MDSVMKYVTGFFAGLGLITSIGEGGFVGLVVLVLIVSFFTKK